MENSNNGTVFYHVDSLVKLLKYPVCEICNKSVDSFEVFHIVCSGKIKFVAICHGIVKIIWLYEDGFLEKKTMNIENYRACVENGKF